MRFEAFSSGPGNFSGVEGCVLHNTPPGPLPECSSPNELSIFAVLDFHFQQFLFEGGMCCPMSKRSIALPTVMMGSGGLRIP